MLPCPEEIDETTETPAAPRGERGSRPGPGRGRPHLRRRTVQRRRTEHVSGDLHRRERVARQLPGRAETDQHRHHRTVLVAGRVGVRREPEAHQHVERHVYPIGCGRHRQGRRLQRHPRPGSQRHRRIPGHRHRDERRAYGLHSRRQLLRYAVLARSVRCSVSLGVPLHGTVTSPGVPLHGAIGFAIGFGIAAFGRTRRQPVPRCAGLRQPELGRPRPRRGDRRRRHPRHQDEHRRHDTHRGVAGPHRGHRRKTPPAMGLLAHLDAALAQTVRQRQRP